MIGFTHKGRKLGEFEDDFKEQIDLSSDDEAAGRDKGKLTEEMVNVMNFGGGENPEGVSVKACLNFCRICPNARKQGRKFSMKLLRSPKRGMLPEKRSKRSTTSSRTSWTMNIKTLLVFWISREKSSMMSQSRKKQTLFRMKRLQIVLERLSRLLRSSRSLRWPRMKKRFRGAKSFSKRRRQKLKKRPRHVNETKKQWARGNKPSNETLSRQR